MKLLLVNQTRSRAPEKWLKRWVARLKPKNKELVVVLVGRSEIRRLNRVYRGKDYATDVLSFESADSDAVGELVICPAVIREQSKSTGLSERGELGYMIVHGVLHLLGFDHADTKSEADMFARQDRLFTDLERLVGLR